MATSDGDFVDLDWTEGATGSPLLLLLHGLEGSSRSHYMIGLARLALTRGWRTVSLNFRSCSDELNLLPRFYHSGDTGDLDAVAGLLAEREPGVRLGAVGFSLGGNVLLKWLGEREHEAPGYVLGAVAVSVPFDLAACTRLLDRGFRRALYTENFLKGMRDKVRRKAERLGAFVDVTAATRARTFGEYDEVVTAPLNGFASALDYWTRASSGPYLGRIRRPTLLISARDDPFVPPDALPDVRRLPPNVIAEFPTRGGHAGFIDGAPWRATSWAERRAIAFLDPLLA